MRCRFPAKLLGADRLTAAGLFTRGMARGTDCLGCCWALMVAMLAVGVMNIIWMVGLTAVMSLEKLLPGDGIRRAIGLGLMIAAALIFAQSPAGMRLLHLG
jgi:predicted metal-binding membrane protein